MPAIMHDGLRWLNEDLALKQRVLNLEHDLSNGYLLGEILHIHNHQPNFALFQELETSEAKVNNFILLEPTIRLLGVPFDAKVAYNVMRGTPGAINSLLYQMKMVLDRLVKFSVPVSMRPTTSPAGVKPLPNLSQRTTKPQYDRATHSIFAAAVRDMVQSQKGINLERSLRRFEVEGARQKRIVQVEKERSLLAEELHTEAIRLQGIHDLAQRKALCDSWEENNVDGWLINMDRKRNRELRIDRFRRRVVRARVSRIQQAKMVGQRAVQYDLPAFEARSREASRTASGNQEEHEATPWAFAASTRGFLEARALEKGYKWQMAKFHSKRSEERIGAREKRSRISPASNCPRRRFITEREESQSHEHLQAGADALKQKLMKRCYAEELVERQLESVFRYKAIMTENREYRKQQYAARADVDAEGLLKRDQASLDSFRRQYELGVRAQAERCEAAAVTTAAAAATRIEKMCRETLEGLFALSMEVVRYRAYSEHRREPGALSPDQDPMPSLQWKDMKCSFIRGGPLLHMGTTVTEPAKEWGCTSLLPLAEGRIDEFCAPGQDDETKETVAYFLDGCEFEDYINETGWWGKHGTTSGPKDFAQAASVADVTQADLGSSKSSMEDGDDARAVDPTGSQEPSAPSSIAGGEENVLNTANPLHGLGECVIETALAANPLPPPRPPPDVPTFSLRICMCGRTLTGKSEQAIRLADRYCLKVYAALLVEAIREIEEENQAVQAQASESSEVGGVMLSGDDRAEYMGWIIDDFPGTAEQAVVLEKYLSGYDESAHVPSRQDATSKLAPASPLSEATEDKGTPMSGIDLAIYIDAPRDVILKRSLGRLFDPVTAEPYHFEGALPQYDVVCKERLVHPEDPANASAELSLQVATQEQTSEELKTFLEKFGTLRMVDSGDSTPDALFGKLNAVVVAMVQEAGERDTKSEGGDLTGDCAALHHGDEGEDARDKRHDDHDGLDGASAREPSITDGVVDGRGTPAEQQPKEAASTDEGSSALGNGVSSSTFASTAESARSAQERGKEGGLLAGGLAVALSGHWRTAELHFEDTGRRVFRELRNQRLSINGHVRSLRDTFSAFLRRPDDKQSHLAEFCSSFNALDQDLRFDDRARKELLLRTEECRSKLWFNVEERKEHAAKVLGTIQGDAGWVERQQGTVSNNMILLMQAEVERFHAGVLLLHDYYQIKVQEVTNDNSVVLTLLLPPEAEGAPVKETPGPKSSGKKDKDGKGGGKKGHEGKGGKGSKGDPSGDPSFGALRTTPWPPIEALASLVDVIAAGDMTQVAVEAEKTGGAAAQGKGKAEKGKKPASKSARKADVEVEEAKTPLEAALSVVMAYADAWGSDAFPVPAEDEVASQAGDGATGASASSVQRVPPPKPFLLHRAVWAQAGVLTTRCLLLSRVGETLSAGIRKKADLVYGELQRCLDERVSEEQRAVEAAMTMAEECIDEQSAIEHEWNIQGKSFSVDENFRLVPVPITNVSRPGVSETLGVFTKLQALRLQDALASIQHVGTEGLDDAMVMPEDVVEVLLRLSAEEGALPDCWASASKADLIQVATRFLDPEQTGQVEVEKVVSSITSKTPEELILLA
ncbi:unnamed protein product [Ectocarpus sp. 4 AP-2014]